MTSILSLGIVSRIRIENLAGLGAVEFTADDRRLAVSAGARRWEAELPAYYGNSNEWLRDATPDQFVALLAPGSRKAALNVEGMRESLRAAVCQARRRRTLVRDESRALFDAVGELDAEGSAEAFEQLQGTGLFDALGDVAMDAVAGSVAVTATEEAEGLLLVHAVLIAALRA